MVPGRLVLGVFGVDEIGVLDAVVVDHREAVDVGLLGYRACFLRCDALGAGDRDESKTRKYACGEESATALFHVRRELHCILRHFSGGNTTFQSFFMSTTVQPLRVRLVERLVELADVRRAVVGPFALGVGVVDEPHEARARSGRGPLEHLLIAVGVAEGEDRAAADEAVDADRLARPSSMKSILVP